MNIARTLFAKIFLWFWGSIGLMLCVLAGGAWLTARNVRPTDAHMAEPFRIVANSAGHVLRSSGPAALDSMLTLLSTRDRLPSYFVGEAHTEDWRALPPDVAAMAREILARGDNAVWMRGGKVLFGYPVEGPASERFVIIFAPTPMPGGLGFLFPLTQTRPYLFFIVILLMTSLVCFGLASGLVAPVVRLRDATRRIAAGDLSARTGFASRTPGDELEALARDFDTMAGRIETLVSVERRLLRDISHELRSPLARMNVAISLARDRSGPEAGPMLDRIERESERLNQLISQLLMLARLEGEVRQIELERFDLAEVVDRVVADARFESQAAGREVARIGETELEFDGNAALIESAIENVVRNALRFGPAGEQVELDLARDPKTGHAVVSVRDRGPGVPQDQLEAIFRPFHRVSDARDRASGGVGLGLAIAQRAVAVHGGTIEARNCADGGLLVEIRLPVRGTAAV